MLFHSLQFAVFFPIVFGLYLILDRTWQNRMLLIASYIFYGSWDWRFLSLLLISTATDFICGIGIEKTTLVIRKKLFVLCSVVINLGLLCTFKYYDFFAASLQDLLLLGGVSIQPNYLNVILPIGISFYTFQTLSYTVDVYRGKVSSCKNIFDFALYVSFFPQLIAGPIERGTRLLPQLLNKRQITKSNFYVGSYFFLWGMFLKVFGADNLAQIVDPVFESTGPYNGANVLLAVYGFSIQIYCDFAGYSFMAIGLAKSMGIDLVENFRRPYFSLSISDFWRRWHISLSSWFRDYFFTPFYIYMEKRSVLKRFPLIVRHGVAFFLTLLITEFVLGLWHGAGWNFAFFGVYHGLAIWLYYMVRKPWNRMNRYIQILFTFHIACGGWLVFRAQSLSQCWDMFISLFINFTFDAALFPIELTVLPIFIIGILFTIQVLQERSNNTLIVLSWPKLIRYPFFMLLLTLIIVFGDFSDKPFIYFQF